MEFCDGDMVYNTTSQDIYHPRDTYDTKKNTDETARTSNLVQPLHGKATARLTTHACTHTCDSFELSMIGEHGCTHPATHASTIHGLNALVRENTLIHDFFKDE